MVIPDGLTLWLTEQIPQVGSLVQVTERSGSVRANIVSNMIAESIDPVAGSSRNLDATITSDSSAGAALNFFGKFAPSLSGSTARAVILETKNNKTWVAPPQLQFKEALVAFDRPGSTEQNNARALISRQNIEGVGSMYIVTAVYIAEAVTLKQSRTDNVGAGFSCDLGNVTCGEVKFSDKDVVDGQMRATGAPIFVRLKWVGERPGTGLFGWDEDSEGPKVVTGS